MAPTTGRGPLLLLGFRNFRSVTLALCQEQSGTEWQGSEQLACELPLAGGLELSPHPTEP